MQSPTRQSPPAPTPSDRWVWAWSVAGLLVGLLLGVTGFAPARWMQPALCAWSGGHLLLEDSAGTLWQGSARMVLSGGAGSLDARRLPGRVHWHIVPHMAWLELQLHAECCTASALQIRFVPSLQGWYAELEPAQATWPASLLGGLGDPWNSIQLEGTLHLRTGGFQMALHGQQMAMSGEITLLAPALRARLFGVLPVGSYRLILVGGADPALRLETVEGALQLSGSGHWENSQLHMQVLAQTRAQEQSELGNLLRLLAQFRGRLTVVTPS